MKQGISIRALAKDSTEMIVDVVGVIGWSVEYSKVRDILKNIPQEITRVIFEIFSPGGDVWEGNGIIQDIGAMKQETVARVQVAASMATLIAVACKTREIASNGRWLIHNPWTALMGDAAMLEKRAKELRDCEAEAAAFYAQRTGQTIEKMIDLMAEERWLTPAETKEFGFVQTINDPFDAAAYADVKAEIVAAGKWPKALADIPVEPESIKTEGNNMEVKPDANAIPTGTASESTATVVLPIQPADEALKAADVAGYKRGYADGKTADQAEHVQKLGIITATVEELKKQNGNLDGLQRKFQGERDSARAQVEKLTATLKEATTKLERLLSGGMSFAPSVDTWADALKACGGDYEKARKQFPELYRASREQDKINRK